MKIRTLIAIGLVLVGAAAAASAAVADRRTDDATVARHRTTRPHRPTAPRTPRTPEPTSAPTRQTGSSEGTGKHIEGSVTEHHRISGSGAISVSSGAVDEGTGGGDAHASRVGPPIGRRRR